MIKLLALGAVLAAGLSACGGSSTSGTTSSGGSSAAATGAVLAPAHTTLGTVLVDQAAARGLRAGRHREGRRWRLDGDRRRLAGLHLRPGLVPRGRDGRRREELRRRLVRRVAGRAAGEARLVGDAVDVLGPGRLLSPSGLSARLVGAGPQQSRDAPVPVELRVVAAAVAVRHRREPAAVHEALRPEPWSHPAHPPAVVPADIPPDNGVPPAGAGPRSTVNDPFGSLRPRPPSAPRPSCWAARGAAPPASSGSRAGRTAPPTPARRNGPAAA